MIFNLLIIHNRDRTSSITRVLHTTTWDYFYCCLPYRFFRSPKAVKKAITTDINDLVQEFLRTSSDVGASFFAMRHLLEILQRCLYSLVVCINIISFLRLQLIKFYSPISVSIPPSRTFKMTTESNLRYCLMGIERRLISQLLNPKIWVICSCSYLVS